MSDSGDKSEKASGQKLSKARKKGQIARSKEFSSAIALIVAVSYFMAYGAELRTTIFNLFETAWTFDAQTSADLTLILRLLGEAFFIFIKVFAPLMLFQFLVTFLSSSVLGGLHMNFSLLAPKFSKINPISGFGRIFSKNTMVEFLKSVLKISIILTMLFFMLRTNMGEIGGLVRAPLHTTINSALGHYMVEMITMLISVAVVFGLLDIPYQKHTFDSQMKMTKQEVKQEHKEQEGSPEVKGRRRQLQMQYARNSANRTVPTADVVLMNPTHYAVALKYDITRSEAPFVVAKGKDQVAFYIRSLADKHDIEVLIVPEITRSIYHTTQVNQMIPNQLFVAVAHILKYVQQLKAWKHGSQPKPNSLPNFFIPDNLKF